ncbi:MAG TPA: radical SAM protein [Chloroflexia bacterium]|nr:radical SAM protein [Chloroflexia bacterium]
MKVILFNPVSAPPGRRYLPLSLLALGAVLEGQFEYQIVDANLEANPIERLVALLQSPANQDGKGTVLGVTVMPGPQLNHAIEICPRVKAILPACTIVWGGYFPTEHPEVSLRANYVDFVVRGQGEATFTELLNWLENCYAVEELAAIKGLSYKVEGRIRHNSDRELLSLQNLPALPYHRVPVTSYVTPSAIGQRTLPHNSSFGCPFKCNFCAVVSMVDGGWLAENGERTAATVRYLHDEFEADSVIFVDNNFFTAEKRVRRYAERLIELGLEGKVSWWGEGRIDTLIKYRPETWQLLKRAGCTMIFMGAESGSDETLAHMNKGGKASTALTLEIARRLKTYGIVPEFSFILGNPPDPDADIKSTISFIKQVKRVNEATEIILYLYSPEPVEGDLLEAATAGGFRFPQTLEEWASPNWKDFAHRHNPHTPWLALRHRRLVAAFGQVLNAYYPTTTNPSLADWRGSLTRTVASWRYHTGFYHYPLELKVLDKFLGYQRRDTRAC